MSAFADAGSIGPQQIWARRSRAASVHGEQITLALIELDPNGDVPEHSHANEQVGILSRGR